MAGHLAIAGAGSVPAAAAAGSTPDAIFGADLWGWYKDAGLAGADLAALSGWSDSSGNARHLAQVVVADQPTKRTGVANGLPVARFDGATEFFDVPSMAALSTAVTVFCVAKWDVDPPAAQAQTGFWRLGTSSIGIHVPYTDGTIYDDACADARKTTGDPALSLSAAFRVYSVYSAANSWRNFVNNSPVAAEVTTNTVACNASPTLGKAGDFFDGDMAEIVIASVKATTQQLADMQTYFASRFAL